MLSYLGHQNTVLTSFLIQRSSIDPSLLISMLQKPSRFKVKVTRPPNVTVWKKPEISRTKNNELHVCYSYPQFWTDWAQNVRECSKNIFVDTFLTGQGGGGCHLRRVCMFFLFIRLKNMSKDEKSQECCSFRW